MWARRFSIRLSYLIEPVISEAPKTPGGGGDLQSMGFVENNWRKEAFSGSCHENFASRSFLF